MPFNKDQVLEAFDDLVAREIVLYGPETVVDVEEKGFQFEFRICPALTTKPSTTDATEDAAFDKASKYGPGSDLADADAKLIVSKVHNTHLLVLNRFAVFRPQYLIITLDSFKRQTESLDGNDLAAAWEVLQELPDDHYVMYNCGNEAGCSRLHKHMQVIPCPDDFKLFPDRESFDPTAIPFKHFLRRIDPSTRVGSSSLLRIYQGLHREALQAWQSCTETTPEYFPHNVILTKRWMMVIPRRRAAIQGASANAAGMMGMVWVMNTPQLDKWKEYGPLRVLEQLGVPSRHNPPAKNGSVI